MCRFCSSAVSDVELQRNLLDRIALWTRKCLLIWPLRSSCRFSQGDEFSLARPITSETSYLNGRRTDIRRKLPGTVRLLPLKQISQRQLANCHTTIKDLTSRCLRGPNDTLLTFRKGFLPLPATERDSNSPTSIISTAYAFEKREYCYEEGCFRGALEFSAKLLS